YGGYDPLPWSIDSAVRPFSTVGNSDTYGHFITVSSVAAAAVAAMPHGLSRMWRLVALALAGAALLAAALAAAGGSVLGVGAALVVLPLVMRRFYGVKGRELRRVLALEVAAVGVGVAATAC